MLAPYHIPPSSLIVIPHPKQEYRTPPCVLGHTVPIHGNCVYGKKSIRPSSPPSPLPSLWTNANLILSYKEVRIQQNLLRLLGTLTYNFALHCTARKLAQQNLFRLLGILTYNFALHCMAHKLAQQIIGNPPRADNQLRNRRSMNSPT